MRSFQLISLILFLGFFLLTTFGTYRNLKAITQNHMKKVLKAGFMIFHILVFILFIYLYIYPNQPRGASNYSIYMIFNFVLFALFIFNIPNALAFLLHSIFRRRKAPVIPMAGFIIALSIVIAMAFGTIQGPRQLKTVYHQLNYDDLPESFDGYKILLFTDTHLGGMLFPKTLFNKAAEVADDVEPDLVLFAGDLVNNYSHETRNIHDLFLPITRNRQSFSILGNHDYGDYSDWDNESLKRDNFNGILKSNSDLGMQLLRNEHTVIKRGTDSIYIAGVENWGHPPFPQYANLEAALDHIPAGAFIILLTHDPAHWESQIENKKDIQLTFSGHTHGMQWGIKLAGIPFSLAYLTRKYWGGFYGNNNSRLYVNTGFGTVGVPWRLDMPPELTVITLKRVKADG